MLRTTEQIFVSLRSNVLHLGNYLLGLVLVGVFINSFSLHSVCWLSFGDFGMLIYN